MEDFSFTLAPTSITPQTLIMAPCHPLPSTTQAAQLSVTVDSGLSYTWNHIVLLFPGFFNQRNYSEMCPCIKYIEGLFQAGFWATLSWASVRLSVTNPSLLR